MADVDHAAVSCRELAFEPAGLLDHVPPRTNWTLRSSMAARSAVRSLERGRPLDALFVHTHVPATLLGSTMARVPTVVSIDATPKQIDELGGSYQHRIYPDPIETAKRRMHQRCFSGAASLVSWSQWAADSLVTDYGVDRDRIEVIPPGVIPSQWRRDQARAAVDGAPIKVLFVGGDFERKGGHLLLGAFDRLRNDHELIGQGISVELHLVTSAAIAARPGVEIHHGLTPNSPELIELFHSSDIFALPTLGDCTPLVLAEAATAGLPTVATDVGAVSESVVDGVTGHLVEPTVESIANGLRRLLVDGDHRLALGHNAVLHAARTMDSEKNARRILDNVVENAKLQRTACRVMLTVSGDLAPDIDDAIEAGIRPLADYVAISRATGAKLHDWSKVRREGTAVTEFLRHLGGNNLAMAYHLYRHRHQFDVVITDGEQVGLPFAAFLKWAGERELRHVMIAHKLSPKKKTIPTRLLGLAENIDDVLVYSSSQQRVASRLFNRPGQRVHLIDFMVDTEFFRPTRSIDAPDGDRRPRLCTAGREFRDYPTFIEAVRDLDVDVIIASASPWSRREDNAHSVELPDNVEVTALSQRELRDELDESDILVMPLLESDFQAGITTILEAMAMGRPVVCTATEGQTDVVVDGVNGRYVAPGDPAAMRQAILDVIEHLGRAAEMGRSGRELAEQRADVRVYAELFADIVDQTVTRD